MRRSKRLFRSKRSKQSPRLSSISLTILSCATVLCSVMFASACGNSDPGTTIVVTPNQRPASTQPELDQNNPDAINSASVDDIASSINTSPDDVVPNQPQLDAVASTSTQPPVDIQEAPAMVPVNLTNGLPQDCLYDISEANQTFCYQASTRMLRAWQPDGSQWWGFALPGDNASNEIHALHVVDGNLYIVAELKTNGEQFGFEVSMFEFGGAFVKTVAIKKFHDYSFLNGARIQAGDLGNKLVISGDYGLAPYNILPNQFNGTFIAVYNTATDKIENSTLFPQLRQTNPMQINGENITLELEHFAYTLTPENLNLGEPVTRFQSIPFHRTNYHQKKRGLIGFIEKPPLEVLHTQMNEFFMQALKEKQSINPGTLIDEPVECAGGGTMVQSFVVDNMASEVRTTTFENCVTAQFSANGVLLLRQTGSCGINCEGLNRTIRALGFEVTYSNGENWSVDGYITNKETRNTVSQSLEPIKNPETQYENLTEFNSFSVSDNELTINLAQSQYQYNGTLKNGTGTWVGSGTVAYATGEIETFSIDLTRQLLNGTQVNFSGQLDANRSDNTALFVGADSTDIAAVQYTTTTAEQSTQQ